MKTHTLSSLLTIAALLLASCTGNTPAAPGASTATPAVQATALPIAPAITLKPEQASFDTTVTITGSGFPARTRIKIYLGVARYEQALQPYVAAVTDDTGNFIVALSMPDRWASGASITETNLTLVAANDDFSLQAEAPLSFQLAAAAEPSPPPPTGDAAASTGCPHHTDPCAHRAECARQLRVPERALRAWHHFDSVDQTCAECHRELAGPQRRHHVGSNSSAGWPRGLGLYSVLQASVAIASLPLASTLPPTQGPGLPRPPRPQPCAANEQEAALAAAVSFYTQWATGPSPNGNLAQALQYVSKSLADQINADNSSLLRMAGVPSRPRYTPRLRYGGSMAQPR